jgi:CheY-like chemotaxis protein
MDQKHILVVDDEEENQFDLALVDLSMPGLDGFGLIGLLTHDKTFKSKVLVVSGRVLDKDVERAMETGASGYIAKPYDQVTLLARVEELLG